jgi:hypothetical protein
MIHRIARSAASRTTGSVLSTICGSIARPDAGMRRRKMPASIDDLLKEQQKTNAILAAIYQQVLTVNKELGFAKLERQSDRNKARQQYKPYTAWQRFRYWLKGMIRE